MPEAVELVVGDLTLRGDHYPGDPSKKVLLLHGGGQTRHSWGHSAEVLSGMGWTTWSLDLRGHGDSDWDPEANYGPEGNVVDIVGVAEQIGPGIVYVGASLGGLTSLLVQAQAPPWGRALVLVDVVPRVESAGTARIRDFMMGHVDGFDTLEDVADAVAEYKGRPRPQDVSGLHKNVRLRDDGRFHWHWDPAMTPRTTDISGHPPLPVEPLLEAARQITVPTLIVRGEQSDVVSDEGVDEVLEAIPHAEVAVVPKAGHMVAGDDNDRFTVAVRDFLSGLGGEQGLHEA